MKDLNKCREEIDLIDIQLMELFEKRMNVVKEIVEYKIENGLEVYQPSREQAVYDKNINRIKNEDLKSYAQLFIQEFVTVSKAYQADLLPLTSNEDYKSQFKENPIVGYQGVAGAFSQSALEKFFGEGTKNIGYAEFEDVYKALEKGDIDYGILPIENSLTGSINDNYDLIRKYNFNIVGEVSVPVSQCLMGLPEANIEDITKVYSHPQGLAQTSEFFNEHKHMEPMPYKDTAMAAQYVKERNEINKAAIASPLACKLYGLKMLKANIQNDATNKTRFMVISKELICPIEANKMSAVFTLKNEVGTLYNMLQIIRQSQVNLVRIESRPIQEESWHYYFYIDFEGNIRDEKMKRAIDKMKANCSKFRILGSYVKK